MPTAVDQNPGWRRPQPLPSAADAFSDPLHAEVARWRAEYPVLKTWLDAGVPVAGALRRLGLTLWSAGRLEAAARALGGAVRADDRDGAAWLDLGFCLRALGALGQARDAFERAALAAPGQARAWLAFGLALKETGDLLQAERALARAVALDGELYDAAYSLGLLFFDARRYAEAAACWRGPVARGYKSGAIRTGLGQCLFFLGDFASAAQLLGVHLADCPDDEAIVRRYALAAFLDAAIEGGPEAARAAYLAAAGERAEPMAPIARVGVMVLAAYGHNAAALALARAFFDSAVDPILRHHIAALSGEPRMRAPADYVAAYFDRFAPTFDDQMASLGYRGPEKLVALLNSLGPGARRTIDLGCGSGAAAALLRPHSDLLVGVDLSVKMIEKARGRGLYDELVVSDMVDCLFARSGAFDLAFAADCLIYLGDLEPFVKAAAGALLPGGLLAATLETGTDAPYALQTSGRFAHSPEALIESAARWFELRALQPTFLRLEANRETHGALIVLQRRP